VPAPDDPFDPKILHEEPPPINNPGNKPRNKRIPRSKLPFIKIPTAWDDALNTLPPRSSIRVYCFAVHLLREYLKSWNNDKTIKLTNEGLNGKMDRFSKYRMLRILRKLGLIVVEGNPRKSPTVHLLHTE
jgi:hypothetical protein